MSELTAPEKSEWTPGYCPASTEAVRHDAAPAFGITDIGVYLPERRLATAPRAPELGIAADTLHNRIGFAALARKAEGEDTSDLAFHAIQDLLHRHPVDPADIGCLVVVTQNPDGFGIPQVSALLHGRLGWPNTVPAFDLSLGCSGYVYGLAVVAGFLTTQNTKVGILVTADPYSKIVDPEDRNTALLFGDGASATLIENNGPWQLGRFDFGTAGDHAHCLRTDEQRHLRMDGPAIARFCLREIPKSIQRTLERNKLISTEVDRFVLHQGSRCIVEDIAKAMGVKDKTPFLAEGIGNTTSSSVPIALRRVLDESPDARTIVISTFGIGMSWGTVTVSRSVHPIIASMPRITKGREMIHDLYNRMLNGAAFETMDELVSALFTKRATLHASAWKSYVSDVLLRHPIRELIHLDPFTFRAFSKPRGYAGDAEMIDMIYSAEYASNKVDLVGKEIFRYTTESTAPRAVRSRRQRLANLIDDTIHNRSNARILAIAAGHLRELELVRSITNNFDGEIVALDQDPDSLAIVDREYSRRGVRVLHASVRQLLARKINLGSFDLVYAAGLLDYLTQPIAKALCDEMFRMLNPAGRMVVANFVPGIPDVGYMESFMDWRLIYRDEIAMRDLIAGVGRDQMSSTDLSLDGTRNIAYLSVVRRGIQ